MSSHAPSRFNPFPGLRPFSIEEDYLFFGREEQTSELLALLREHRFLGVVGTSGSGKSSLVRAGLLPALHGGTMTDAGSSWEVAILRPGGNPIANLARAMLEADLYDPDDEESLPRIIATLNRSRQGLIEAVRQSDLPDGTNLLVVVDQFEELFRFRQQGTAGQEAAAAFVKLLLSASDQAELPIYVAITMRSDYLGECSQIPGLAEAVNDGEYLIPRLSREQRRAAIEKPAAVGGGTIAHRLVQKLLNDVGDDADQLPVLQHALMRIWDFWAAENDDQAQIDLKHYEQAGGLSEALSRHADEVYEELSDDRLRLVAERLFKALTERGPDNRGIRRPTRLEKLCAIADASQEEVTQVIDAFRRQGRTFLMPMADVELLPQTVVDISHESLMRVWKRLDGWVEEESQSARIYRRLAETAALHADGKAGLFHDPDLQIALSWRETNQPTDAWGARYHDGFDQAMSFLDTSQEAAEAGEREREAARQRELEQAKKLAETEHLRAQEQQRSAKRLKGLVAAVGVVAALAGVAFIVAMIARNQASQNATRAELAETQARQEAAEALAAQQRAIEARNDAQAAQADAIEAQQQAELARQDAERQRERARQGMYVSQINTAQRVAESPTGSERLQRLLAELRPEADQADQRDWEWYYLNSPRNVGGQVIGGGTSLICVDYSPDGRKLVFGGMNRELTVWDLQTNRELVTLVGHESLVLNVTWSPDGKWIASGSLDSTVRIWDAETGIPVHTISGQGGPSTASWSSDSLQVAVLNAVDGMVGIWDVSTGKMIRQVTDQATAEVAWSPDGTRLATSMRDGSIVIWDLSNDQQIATIPHQGGFVSDFDWNPDATRLVACDQSGNVTVWDAQTGEVVLGSLSGHTDVVFTVNWSPDGESILTSSFDGTSRIYDAKTGRSLRTLRGHVSRVFGNAWNPDSRSAATVSLDSRLIIWDLDQDRQTENVIAAHRQQLVGLDYSPDGKRFVTTGRDGSLIVWDAETREKLQELTRNFSGVTTVAWSSDGMWIASGHSRGAIRIWDPNSGTEQAVLSLSGNGGQILSLSWNPEQHLLAVAAGTNAAIWNLEDADNPVRTTLPSQNDVESVAWNPDGSRLASAGSLTQSERQGNLPVIQIWDPDSGEQVGGLSGEAEEIETLAWSPDGEWLASGGRVSGTVGGLDVSVRVWNVATGQQVAVMRNHTAPVTALDWNPEGTRLISSSFDGTLRLWNPMNGRELLNLPNGGPTTSTAWSPDGSQILAGDTAGNVRFYDARSGYERDFSDELMTDLNQRIESGSASAEDVRLRAEIHARHGRWDLAAADFQMADQNSPSEEAPQWYSTPWWVLGPFEREAAELDPAVTPLDPFAPLTQPNADLDDSQIVRWQSASPDESNGLDLRRYFDPAYEMDCYVYTRVYAPREQMVGLLLGSDDMHRIWINGSMVHEHQRPRAAALDQDAALITLQAGWNDVVVKVTNTFGDYGLYLRFSTDGQALAKAFDRSGDWQSALQQWNFVIENDPENIPARLRRSRTAQNAGMFDLAVADLTAVMEYLPNNLALLRERAELYKRLGRHDEVAADYRRLVEFAPDDWELRMEVGRLYAHISETIIVPPTSAWRWLHPTDGVDPAQNDPDFHSTFFRPDFDDSAWSLDNDSPGAEGGFGFGDRQLVNIGTPLPNSLTSAYFRHRFTTHATYEDLSISLYRDDGVIIYLDGEEVGRDNIRPSMSEQFELLADGSVDEGELQQVVLTSRLEPSEHLLAIALHNRSANSSDLHLAEVTLKGRPTEINDAVVPLDHPAELIGRGLELAELGQDDLADADFAAAIEIARTEFGTPEELARQLVALATKATNEGELASAIRIQSAAIKLSPESADALYTRGELYGRSGQWQAATDDLLRVIELDPERHFAWYQLAPLLLETEGPERYREHCRKMIERFRDASPLEVGRVFLGCMLDPEALADWDAYTDLADRMLQVSEGLQKYRLTGKGMYLYRAGNIREALKWIPQGMEDLPDASKARSQAFLALARYQNGGYGQAAGALKQANSLVNRTFQDLRENGDLGENWHDWVSSRLLVTEAIDFATELNEVDPAVLVSRGNRNALDREWEAATVDYRKAAELGTEDSIAWIRGAILLARNGSLDEYQAYCRAMREQLDVSDPMIAERVAKTSLLHPVTASLAASINEIADTAVSDAGHWVIPWAQIAKGLAEYRAEKYQSAIDWCQKPHNGQEMWYRSIHGLMIQSMAYSKLEQSNEAEAAFQQATQLLEAQTALYEQEGLDASWHDWLVCYILLEEAQALIDGEAAP